MEVKDREDKDIRQPDLKSMNMEELRNWVIGAGQPAFRAKQIYQWFHVKLADGTEEMLYRKDACHHLQEKDRTLHYVYHEGVGRGRFLPVLLRFR